MIMTEQDKQLLLQDLCARLPYGVMMQYHTDYDWTPVKMRNISKYTFNDTYSLENAKPYLRPLESMTDEERKELKSILREKDFGVDVHEELIIYTDTEYDCDYYFSDFYEVQDWLNAHHFDYRGLILKGLALSAPEGMYNMEE